MKIELTKNILLCGGSSNNRIDLLKQIIKRINPNRKVMLVDINKVDLYDFYELQNLLNNKTYRDNYYTFVVMKELKNSPITIVISELADLYHYDKVEIKKLLHYYKDTRITNFICATHRTDVFMLDDETLTYFDYIVCFKMFYLQDQKRILKKCYPAQKEFEIIIFDTKNQKQKLIKLNK